MSRFFYTQSKSAATHIGSILIPESVKSYRIQAVAPGGDGGAGSATVRGGGGGAGNYFDGEAIIQPNTLLIFTMAAAFLSIEFNRIGTTGRAAKSKITLLAGKPGTLTGGGASGGGMPGGTLTSAESRFGNGFIDRDGRAHTCGGQAAWDVAPPDGAVDFAYSRGVGVNIQRYPVKFPNGYTTISPGPGFGGCSYFGGAVYNTLKSDFGAGGMGGGLSAAGAAGGDAFLMVEWDD